MTGERYNFSLDYEEADIGGIAIDNHGTAFPESTHQICQASDDFIWFCGGPNGNLYRPKSNSNEPLFYLFAKPFLYMPMYVQGFFIVNYLKLRPLKQIAYLMASILFVFGSSLEASISDSQNQLMKKTEKPLLLIQWFTKPARLSV